jgi:hypothetical protein
MEDYPRTVMELEERFSTEQACRDYLIRLRWPSGFVCPHCQTPGNWTATRGRLICRACRYQASVTAGTIFQDTHKPLRMWFRAVWHITSQKNGARAVSLQQVLGLGSYITAWTWLHKLRRAMVRPGRDRLRGTVEVDETYWGGEEKGAVGRLTEDKAIIAVAAEENGKGIGRIRLRCIPDVTRASLHSFIGEAIEPGSTVRTDGLPTRRWRATFTTGRCNAAKTKASICFPESTKWFRCSSDGCWAPIKVPSVMRIWTITSMNLRSDLIAAPPPRVANCSTAYSNKPFKSIQPPTKTSSGESPTTTYSGWWSQLDNHNKECPLYYLF